MYMRSYQRENNLHRQKVRILVIARPRSWLRLRILEYLSQLGSSARTILQRANRINVALLEVYRRIVVGQAINQYARKLQYLRRDRVSTKGMISATDKTWSLRGQPGRASSGTPPRDSPRELWVRAGHRATPPGLLVSHETVRRKKKPVPSQ
jgi:hypothetical protein